MQIVSSGDNMHEMSKPIFLEKQEKYQLVVCWICEFVQIVVKIND